LGSQVEDAFTYYKAKTKNINEVAECMGNAPGIVKRHYARTIPQDECDAFWNLTPEKVMADKPDPNAIIVLPLAV